jgi:hypothetical protein
MKKLNLILLSGFLLLFAGCTKDDNIIIEPPDRSMVMILNQGNFSEHSASVSVYDEVNDVMHNRFYENANGVSIGATIVSGSVGPQGTAYLVCNYPDKIEIINAETGESVGAPITEGLSNPRNVLVTGSRIYVTNWGDEHITGEDGFWQYTNSFVSVYDINSRNLISTVEAGTDAEGLLLFSTSLFVATREGVRVFDVTADRLDEVALIEAEEGSGPAKHISYDNNSMLWVAYPESGVAKIDPFSLSYIRMYDIPVDVDGYITNDYLGNRLYTYKTLFNESYQPEGSHVYIIDPVTGDFTEFAAGNYFYSVGVSPLTGNLFASEVSFTSNSLVKILDRQGMQEGSLTAGVAACRFLFF